MWTKLLAIISLVVSVNAFALDTPTVTATAKGPNQINLMWAAVTNPGWGYTVEIQSDSDSRYSTWTDYTSTLRNGFGYLPYWVTEGHYLDRSDGTGTISGTCIAASSSCGSAAQLMVFGLKYGTTYNFRVRSYGKTDAGAATYSAYSSTATATTTTPGTIRHVKSSATGSNNGTSEANAWTAISSAASVSAGTLVIVHGGTYSTSSISPSNSGTQANRIWYVVDAGETATITPPSDGGVINLSTNYIVIDGISMVDASGTSDWVLTVDGARNIIANTTLDGPSPTYAGYSPYIPGSYCVFENNYWKEYGYDPVRQAANEIGSGGTTWTCAGNWNTLTNSKHEKGSHDTALVRGDYNMILNNAMGLGWGYGVELQGADNTNRASYNLVEGNMMSRADILYTADTSKSNMECSADHSTIRRNAFYGGEFFGLELSPVNQDANYNLVYNNVLYGNGSSGLLNYGNGAVDHNQIVNNVIYNNADGVAYQECDYATIIIPGASYRASTVFHHNLILSRTGSTDYPSRTVQYDSGTSTCRTLAQWEAAEGSVAYSNITTTPSFIDMTNADFHHKSTSGLIGQGASVTDTQWGTIGETDIGMYKYYAIENTNPVQSVTGCTISGGRIQ